MDRLNAPCICHLFPHPEIHAMIARPHRILFAAMMMAGTFIGIAAHAEDWDQWRGPRRDGTVGQSAWPGKLTGALAERWKREHSPSYSGPVILDGLVYTTETIDRKTERVTAYKLDSGETAWTAEWEGYMAVPFFAASNGDWIRSTPAVAPGGLVVLGMRDVLVCLDPKTGAEKWRIDFPNQFKEPMQAFGAVCSPIIIDGAVYVQLGGGLTKVSLDSGEIVWQVLKPEAGMNGGAFSSPSLATIAGETQLLVQTREELCGVDLGTGDVLWNEPIEAFRGMNILTPLAVGDRVFTAAHSGRSHLFDIGQAEGDWTVDETWNQKTQGYMSSPVQIGDFIYLHLKSERFTCLSVADGSIQWTSEPVGKYWSLVQNGNQILSLADDGMLRLIEATPAEYRVIDQTKVAADSWAHIAVQGQTVVVRSLDALTVYDWTTP